MADRPPVWQMVREATSDLVGSTTYAQLKDFIRAKYGDVNDSTMTCQIISSVNHPSRIHYPENSKPRRANSQYDFLYNTGRGKVERYNPEDHGEWEIVADSTGKLSVRQCGFVGEDGEEIDDALNDDLCFPLESHLRDFIARNIAEIRPNGSKLSLYTDAEGRRGVEYPTGVGKIDVLAVDTSGNFVVFELKLSKGPDYAVGQILRYMGWLTKEVANGKKVSGVLVAQEMTEKLKYAVSLVPSITMYEYRLKFDLKKSALA